MNCAYIGIVGSMTPEYLKLLKVGSKIEYFYLSDEDELACKDRCTGTIIGFKVDAQERGRAYNLTREVREMIEDGDLFVWLDATKLTKVVFLKVRRPDGSTIVLDPNWLQIESICAPGMPSQMVSQMPSQMVSPMRGGRGGHRQKLQRSRFNMRLSSPPRRKRSKSRRS
jgi:hypothetical protein